MIAHGGFILAISKISTVTCGKWSGTQDLKQKLLSNFLFFYPCVLHLDVISNPIVGSSRYSSSGLCSSADARSPPYAAPAKVGAQVCPETRPDQASCAIGSGYNYGAFLVCDRDVAA